MPLSNPPERCKGLHQLRAVGRSVEALESLPAPSAELVRVKLGVPIKLWAGNSKCSFFALHCDHERATRPVSSASLHDCGSLAKNASRSSGSHVATCDPDGTDASKADSSSSRSIPSTDLRDSAFAIYPPAALREMGSQIKSNNESVSAGRGLHDSGKCLAGPRADSVSNATHPRMGLQWNTDAYSPTTQDPLLPRSRLELAPSNAERKPTPLMNCSNVRALADRRGFFGFDIVLGYELLLDAGHAQGPLAMGNEYSTSSRLDICSAYSDRTRIARRSTSCGTRARSDNDSRLGGDSRISFMALATATCAGSRASLRWGIPLAELRRCDCSDAHASCFDLRRIRKQRGSCLHAAATIPGKATRRLVPDDDEIGVGRFGIGSLLQGLEHARCFALPKRDPLALASEPASGGRGELSLSMTCGGANPESAGLVVITQNVCVKVVSSFCSQEQFFFANPKDLHSDQGARL